MDRPELFKRKANRVCIFFKVYGFIPCAESLDDIPKFLSSKPVKIGDDAIVYVEAQFRVVKLARSSGHVTNGLYLVDMGPVKFIGPKKFIYGDKVK
jgi:hypothetical protein